MSNKLSKVHPFFVDEFSDNPFHFLQNIFSDKSKYWRPRIDLKSTDKEYILTADLPGCDKKDIHVYLKDNKLTIKGEYSSEEKKEKDQYYYQERCSGSFERSVFLPENIVEPEKINAKFEDGVLKVKIEKNPEPKEHVNEVKVN